jgi:hypothetical protein
MEELVRITEEKMCFRSLIIQIRDYMNENVSVDSFQTLLMSDDMEEDTYNSFLKIRNAVAMLMEDASEETKRRVKEELQ